MTTEKQAGTFKAVGIGGAGGNIVSRLDQMEIAGLECLTMNTDKRPASSSRIRQLLLGEKLTAGLGANGNCELGRQSALESLPAIIEALRGARAVFFLAGLGGGTGTGASPVAVRAAKELGLTTVCLLAEPLGFEPKKRQEAAGRGAEALSALADACLLLPNGSTAVTRLPATATFQAVMAATDEILCQTVRHLISLMNTAGFLGRDLADQRRILRELVAWIQSETLDGQANPFRIGELQPPEPGAALHPGSQGLKSGAEPGELSLEVTGGPMIGTKFAFKGKVSLIIGRQDDCGIVLPDEKISRHHCILEVDPPLVRVRDNGSQNGTYLNGRIIGGRSEKAGPGQGSVAYEMRDGDRLGLGREWVLTLSSPLRDDIVAGLPGEYKMIEPLSHGSRGQVWRVQEEASGRDFALKLVSLRLRPEEGEMAKILREAELGAQLDHPHIVRQYKSWASGGWFYILQELCPGGSLSAWLKRREGRLLPLKTATHIILQTLEALDYIHRAPVRRLPDGKKKKGLVHRDIHPGNILLMDESQLPRVKVGDLGLSKLFGEISGWTDPTRPGEFAGAPEFTPQAQILGYKTAGPPVDVWAAAATYYYLLTGRPPKDLRYDEKLSGRPDGSAAGPGGEKWRQAILVEADPIRAVNPDIPEKLARVIDAALREPPTFVGRSAARLKKRIEAAQ